MAGTNGSQGHPLKGVDLTDPMAFFEALGSSPWAFDFFQVMRRLECLYSDLPRFGEGQFPVDEPIRLGQRPATRFAPSAIADYTPGEDATAGHLRVEFLGMLGPQGPLPLHLTEYAIQRGRHRDHSFSAFLDVFNHRMLALFYRAWANAQPTVNFDRPGPDSDRFGVFLASLFGYGESSLRDRDALPDSARLHFAGRMAPHARNAEGLQAMLQGFFGLPMMIHEFVGQWLDLPPEERTLLGVRGSELGTSMVAGSRVWDCQYRFRVTVGPLSLESYQRLLPGGDSLPRLVALVRSYIDDGLRWDLQLVLRREEVPRFRLGGDSRLGWTTWMTHPASVRPTLDRDGDDICLDAMALASAFSTSVTEVPAQSGAPLKTAPIATDPPDLVEALTDTDPPEN